MEEKAIAFLFLGQRKPWITANEALLITNQPTDLFPFEGKLGIARQRGIETHGHGGYDTTFLELFLHPLEKIYPYLASRLPKLQKQE